MAAIIRADAMTTILRNLSDARAAIQAIETTPGNARHLGAARGNIDVAFDMLLSRVCADVEAEPPIERRAA